LTQLLIELGVGHFWDAVYSVCPHFLLHIQCSLSKITAGFVLATCGVVCDTHHCVKSAQSTVSIFLKQFENILHYSVMIVHLRDLKR